MSLKGPISSAPLAILEDDLNQSIPFWRSPFRVREYEAILRALPGAAVYSTWLGKWTGKFPPEFAAFLAERPTFAGRILPIAMSLDAPPPTARLAYLVFLSSAFAFAHLLERHRIPFCLELYPGGGFAPTQHESEQVMERIFALPNFRRAIVTQPLTQEFLIERGYCRPDQLVYVHGGVFADAEKQSTKPRRRFGQDKDTLDICFVAHRYMPRGEDKGYDLFLEAAQLLLPRSPALRFHVIGDFDERTIPLTPELAARLRFYGPRSSAFLRDFFASADVIVSPNRASTLAPGAFDGFPTGCCIEAGLQGTVVVCSDPLRLNRDYRAGEDLLLVREEAGAVAACLEQFLDDPERLRRIGECGQRTFRRLFDPAAQMGPRLRLLEQELAKGQPFNWRRWLGLKERPPRRIRCVYNPTELAASVTRLTPDDETLKRHGIDYELIQMHYGGRIMIACPPPQAGGTTDLLLKLPYTKRNPVARVKFSVLPFRPFSDCEPFPMQLRATGHDRPEAPPVAEQVVSVLPHSTSMEIILESRKGGPIRCVKFRLRLTEGAEHNRNAIVILSRIVGAEARAA